MYSDDVTEPLTPSHLLVGHRSLTLPGGTISQDADDEYNPTSATLTRRAAHLAKSLENFWKRWKLEYLQELRKFHRTGQQGESTNSLQPGEVVTVYGEDHPRGLWRLSKVEEVIPTADGNIHGVLMKVVSKGGQVQFIRRPVQHIYPLEVTSHSADKDVPVEESRDVPHSEDLSPIRPRSSRRAAVQARYRIAGMMMDHELDD